MNPRSKMNLAMFVVFVIGLAAIGFVADTILKENARQEVIEKARIMRASALAMRGYTANEIRPLPQQPDATGFVLHTVPSFAAQTNFELAMTERILPLLVKLAYVLQRVSNQTFDLPEAEGEPDKERIEATFVEIRKLFDGQMEIMAEAGKSTEIGEPNE